MRALAILVVMAAAPAVQADVFVPTRVIRAKETIGPGDVIRHPPDDPGGTADLDDVVGLEALVTLYPNRPIRAGDVGEPAIVERNQRVTLVYASGGLRIVTEGRALARGASGERVRVLNLASRVPVTGRVRDDGWIEVE